MNEEKISWTDHVRNEEVLLQVNEQRNILHAIRKRKANWIGHILCRICILKHVVEGKIKEEIEVTGRQGRRLMLWIFSPEKYEGFGRDRTRDLGYQRPAC